MSSCVFESQCIRLGGDISARLFLQVSGKTELQQAVIHIWNIKIYIKDP